MNVPPIYSTTSNSSHLHYGTCSLVTVYMCAWVDNFLAWKSGFDVFGGS